MVTGSQSDQAGETLGLFFIFRNVGLGAEEFSLAGNAGAWVQLANGDFQRELSVVVFAYKANHKGLYQFAHRRNLNGF